MSEELWTEFRAIIEKDRASGNPGLETLEVARARDVMASALLRWGGSGPDMASVTELEATTPEGDIPVTLYTPDAPTGQLPLVVYLHGGGFVLGSVRTHDVLVRCLAAAGRMLVASVDYALAPERPFPAPPAQCLAAARWLREHAREVGGDPTRVAVAGDSSGATIAATVCLMMRALGEAPLAAQCLLYPPLARACDTPSWRRLSTGYFLNRSTMRWFWENYLGDRNGAVLAEPLLAPDLSGLPPTLLVLPGLDPLADEGAAYALRLQEAGVEVQTIHRPGAIHGYLGMTGISPSARDDLMSIGSLIGSLVRVPSGEQPRGPTT